MESIEVLALTPLPNAGSLKALVSIRLRGEVVVHGCKIIQQPGQKAWFALPSREYTGKDGERKFSPVVELPEPLRQEVARVVLAKWQLEYGEPPQASGDPQTPGFHFDFDDDIPDPGEPIRRRRFQYRATGEQ
jgi:DNA-binding cell septation regulator SpoVG